MEYLWGEIKTGSGNSKYTDNLVWVTEEDTRNNSLTKTTNMIVAKKSSLFPFHKSGVLLVWVV